MALAAGTRLGPYEILAAIGAGGMGEVYRARDTKLDRDVAIKVLPSALAQDPERLARFEREAKVLAALNHPNIAQIYGIEQGALVMELVEGENLSGPLPLATAIDYARQIADALESAHEKGIVHRDLKPANIKVTPQGVVKVLDFGLAAVMQNSVPPDSNATQSPTLTLRATQMGVLLGTAAYMSPEQARGKPVDKRADIWAFGVVLYEMITGKPLFHGEDISEVLAAVIKDEPSLDSVPVKVQRLLHSCLEKDPKRRLRDIGDAWRQLEEVSTSPRADTPQMPVEQKRGWLWPAAATILALATLTVSFVHFREPVQQPLILQYTIRVPDQTKILSFAASPDGRYVAMSVLGGGGPQLWLRPLDSLQAQPLPGTDFATYPFWSPDSRNIGFFAQGKLKKIAVSGGPTQTLCDAPNGRGGAWNGDGVIVFNAANAGGLSRVPATGGVPVPATKSAAGAQVFPVFLPDNRHFLFVARGEKESGVYAASLDMKESRRILLDVANPAYDPPAPNDKNGHLLFVRQQTLMAQPVDPVTLEPRGGIFPLAEQVSRNGNAYDLYSISGNGILVYQTGTEGLDYQHTWFDRTGKELGTIGAPVRSNRFALSPDGKRVIIERVNPQSNSSDLWIADLEHRTDSRFTFDASTNSWPVWSPDSSRIVFNSNRGGIANLYQKASNGVGADEVLLQTQENKYPFDWSRDGKYVIFVNQSPKTRLDIWALPLEPSNASEKLIGTKPIPLVQSPFQDWMGQVSPDGRWLAYLSDESGRSEVYVQPFAPENAAAGKPVTGRWQVSTAGGGQPRWRADGEELFYVAPDRKLMSVEVKSNGIGFERSTPQPLFTLQVNVATSGVYVYRYAPAADGKRFLVSTDPQSSAEAPPLNVVANWLARVKN